MPGDSRMPVLHVAWWHALDRMVGGGSYPYTDPARRRAVAQWYADAARCSCGCAEAHITLDRETADGVRLRAWSHGLVSVDLYGHPFAGLGAGTTDASRASHRRAAEEVLRDAWRMISAEAAQAIRDGRKRHREDVRRWAEAAGAEAARAMVAAYRAAQETDG